MKPGEKIIRILTDVAPLRGWLRGFKAEEDLAGDKKDLGQAGQAHGGDKKIGESIRPDGNKALKKVLDWRVK